MYQEVDVIIPRQREDFIETHYIRNLSGRALDYLRAGFPAHFSGPSGVGKTTLALHVAAQLGRPVVLICGDHEFNSSDLVGGFHGYHKSFMRDNFIRSVVKTDESLISHWVDNRLTTACQHGFTLVYDEFTRSRPEANNVFLSVLEEKILPLPAARGEESYLKVHPDFSAIFTSNPEEYAGVYKTQDALRDRMVTLEVGNFDEETEIAITKEKSALAIEDARLIVEMVRRVREAKSDSLTPTVRACVVIGRILKAKGDALLRTGPAFRQVCADILLPGVPRTEREAVTRAIDATLGIYF